MSLTLDDGVRRGEQLGAGEHGEAPHGRASALAHCFHPTAAVCLALPTPAQRHGHPPPLSHDHHYQNKKLRSPFSKKKIIPTVLRRSHIQHHNTFSGLNLTLHSAASRKINHIVGWIEKFLSFGHDLVRKKEGLLNFSPFLPSHRHMLRKNMAELSIKYRQTFW